MQAGLLTNPSLSTFILVSVKQWEWTLCLPLEAFALRPHRVAVAESDYQRVANQLVQNGLTLSVIAVIAIQAILYVDFQSWRLVLLMALMLPLALLGGVVGVLLVGGVVSLGSLVGFVTVLGIAARNAIMLVSHYRHLHTEEGMAFGPELIVRGAEERLASILMTALTTGLALVPLVLSGNVPGQGIEYPMAFVILGGIVTSTVLNLFILPVVYTLARPTHVAPSVPLDA